MLKDKLEKQQQIVDKAEGLELIEFTLQGSIIRII